jgi:hypothetical protein
MMTVRTAVEQLLRYVAVQDRTDFKLVKCVISVIELQNTYLMFMFMDTKENFLDIVYLQSTTLQMSLVLQCSGPLHCYSVLGQYIVTVFWTITLLQCSGPLYCYSVLGHYTITVFWAITSLQCSGPLHFYSVLGRYIITVFWVITLLQYSGPLHCYSVLGHYIVTVFWAITSSNSRVSKSHLCEPNLGDIFFLEAIPLCNSK